MARLDPPVRRETYDQAFRECAAALRDAGICFACMGSLALWALGGPAPNLQQDLDFAIAEPDAASAAAALIAAGFIVEVPREDWLFKAWTGRPSAHDSVLVDLIYAPAGVEVTTDLLARCEVRSVLAMDVRVLSATDLLITKLFSLTEQAADYTSTLQFARSLREQVDWLELAELVEGTPFGEAFLTMVDRLALRPGLPSRDGHPDPRHIRHLASHPGRIGVIEVVRAEHARHAGRSAV